MLSRGAHRLCRQLLLGVVVILELSDGRSPRNWLPTLAPAIIFGYAVKAAEREEQGLPHGH